ncbi:glycosyltransferase [Coriobacteriia bacterium Es71-Z0120]|uniref:glycosyltransferase n=1 Tax=Parvivirga hydrogeniphila TaxID=2939460 RepID=UPI002260C082|nr:glycosyltransferase [Parvivirga hydrogeniphila]MCL4078675.1 glycosyltransferase [Parvivirga hydrogeniphila]
MRIVIVTDTYVPEVNGVVTAIATHTRLLAERGHEILIIAPRYGEHVDEPQRGVRIERYPAFSFVTNKATRVALPAIASVTRKIKAFDPDLVHVHTPLSLGVVGLLAAKALRLPIVQTYHTYIPDFMQYLEISRLLGIDTLQERVVNSLVFERVLESGLWQRIVKSRALIETGLDDFAEAWLGITADVNQSTPELTARLAWRYTRLLYNRSDLVLTPSVTLKRELMRHGVTAPVDHLSNGIDLALVRVKESYARSGRLVHAGRLGYEKNVDVVVKAFARALAHGVDATLDVVGDGPARDSLERLASRLGIEGRVRFLGFVARDELVQRYWEYDAFVTASTIETQGIVLLEAMASGLPVIGVRALAIPEIVRTGRSGIVVAPGDVQSLARAIERLESDDALRERMGRAARGDVQRHEIGLVVSELEELYRQTAAAAGAGLPVEA